VSKYDTGDEMQAIKNFTSGSFVLSVGDIAVIESVRYDFMHGLNEYTLRFTNSQYAMTLHDDEIDVYFRRVRTYSEVARSNTIQVPRVLYKWYRQVGKAIKGKS
jgi:hypothetical protein